MKKVCRSTKNYVNDVSNSVCLTSDVFLKKKYYLLMVKDKILLHIGGHWLFTYFYISANPNEVQGQTSTSTLTEGEFQFITQNMSEPRPNINDYSSMKQDWPQKFLNVCFLVMYLDLFIIDQWPLAALSLTFRYFEIFFWRALQYKRYYWLALIA